MAHTYLLILSRKPDEYLRTKRITSSPDQVAPPGDVGKTGTDFE